ncbi:AI-2E family transporter [Mesobaculum littorinae]|uniref:AI-2E family transporter n=1 Tax=Mesobaculum littorinae TaxID=2486419 RepID=A0A438ALJ7_9RHOB|nr:AI-2E family transporter [Mesobaculum littorinae]RVV99504.1 AI-2E family transporter [Mesobaculum littorinae]
MPGVSFDQFFNRVLLVAGIVILVVASWWVRQTLLLTFGAVIVANILLVGARPLSRITNLPHGVSVVASGLGLTLMVALALWFAAPSLLAQVTQLATDLPAAARTLDSSIGSAFDLQSVMSPDMMKEMAGRMTKWSAALAEGVTGLVLILCVGLFFALTPDVYLKGLIRFFPQKRQDAAADALTCAGTGLRAWLLGQVVAMVAVGTGVTLGTWAIGLPSPLALGLFAGLLEFVPVVGPILGAIPAVLLAMTMSPGMVAWTLGLFLAIEQIESNFLLPMVEKSVAQVPPAVFLLSLVAVGTVFGIIGVILSAPLTVVACVLIDEVYVRPNNGEPHRC